MLKDRLKVLRKEKQLTQKDLADILEVSPKAISFYELGERQPSNEMLLKLAKYFNVSTDYLLGNETMERPQASLIPVLKTMLAETPINTIQNPQEYDMALIAARNSKDYFALRVSDQSMEPWLMKGDTIIIKKQEDCASNQVAVILIGNQEAIVKQVKKTERGIVLIGFNPSICAPHFYTNKEIKELSIRISGVVIESRHRW